MPLIETRADALVIETASGAKEIRHLMAVGTVPGVSILYVAGKNGVGTGLLRTGAGGGTLSWRAPGSSMFGAPVGISADGVLTVEDGEDRDKFLRVRVAAARLNVGAVSAEVRLGDVYDNGLAATDVTGAEASAGDVKVFALQLHNVSVQTLTDIRVWLDPTVNDLEIAPDASSWVAPTSEATALVYALLAAGAVTALDVRRTIAADKGFDPEVTNWLHYTFRSRF